MDRMLLLKILRFITMIIVPSTYFWLFIHMPWVTADDTEWGLWSWCYTNYTADEGGQKCHGIALGDSPGYYEAVRTIACFTLVAFFMLYPTLFEKLWLGKDYRPCIVFASSGGGALILVGLIAGNYRNDDRWKSLDPHLGLSFWLLVPLIVVSLIQIPITLKFVHDHKKIFSTTSPTANRRPARRPSNASILSLDKGRKITIFRTSASEGTTVALPLQQQQQQPSGIQQPASTTTNNNNYSNTLSGGGGGGDGGLPLLNVWRYETPPEPGRDIPVAPPPSYEDVLRGQDSLSPPPVYTPSEAWRHGKK